jgi:hypothetical protein
VGGPGGDALDVQLFGADAATLKAAAEALKTAVAQFPEVSAVEDSLAYDKEELSLELTPQGEALGFDRRSGPRSAQPAERDRGRDLSRRAALGVDPRGGAGGELTADFLDRTLLRTDKRGLRAAGRYRDGHGEAGVFDRRTAKTACAWSPSPAI